MARKVESVNIEETLRPKVDELGIKNFSRYVEGLIAADLAERAGKKAKKDKQIVGWTERLGVLEKRWDAVQARLRGEGKGGEPPAVPE